MNFNTIFFAVQAQERWEKFGDAMDYKARTDSEKIRGAFGESIQAIANAGAQAVEGIRGEYALGNTALQGEYSNRGKLIEANAARDVSQRNKEAAIFGNFLGGFWN